MSRRKTEWWQDAKVEYALLRLGIARNVGEIDTGYLTDKNGRVRIRRTLRSLLISALNAYEVDVNGCWIWLRHKDKEYGRVSFRMVGGKNVSLVAARVFYCVFHGEMDTSLTIDHLCKNPPCVNPEHLELVTRGENTLRGDTMSGRNLRKVTCVRGHLFNAIEDGARRCRVCRNTLRKARYHSDVEFRERLKRFAREFRAQKEAELVGRQ